MWRCWTEVEAGTGFSWRQTTGDFPGDRPPSAARGIRDPDPWPLTPNISTLALQEEAKRLAALDGKSNGNETAILLATPRRARREESSETAS